MSHAAPALFVPTLKNILYATDFSPCAEAALPYVHAIAERYGSTVHVVHAAPAEIPDRIPAQNHEEGEMKALLACNLFSNIAHTSRLLRGSLWEILATVMEEKNIDLIVLDSHGRRGMEKVVLGSVAEQVFRRAECPVLTVGPQAVQEGTVDASFARILFATDYSVSSQRALSYAVSLARANKSHLMLLHATGDDLEALPTTRDSVSAGMQISTQFVAQALVFTRRHLAELISVETMGELNPEIIAECGTADETILRTARGRQVHLIVMGAHHALVRSVASRLPWATTSSVVCQAPCPVLTVRN